MSRKIFVVNSFKRKVQSWFANVPQEHEADFAWDSTQKNNFRFSILPIFNIVTQISCYFIYLYIYPATFPDMPALDPVGFTSFSAIYIIINAGFLIAFNYYRRRNNPIDLKACQRLLLFFLLGYICFESIETIIEVEISGNIYRFLATFFVVSFLPILKRREKFILITLFAVLVELGFAYITLFQGYSSNNQFQSIVVLFYLACLVIANIAYTSTVKTFTLRSELLTANDNLKKANEKLEYLAIIDPLTGVSNRRAFDQYMNLAWRSAYGEQRTVNLIMLDIDNFKAYNDTYGHQQGDECLKTVAQCIKSFFQRESDMVARYGGEEFVVASMQDKLSDSKAYAEKLRRAVEELAIPHESFGTDAVVTISLGVASMTPEKDNRFEDLVKHADDALYAAKDAGRNRVCVYHAVGTTEQ